MRNETHFALGLIVVESVEPVVTLDEDVRGVVRALVLWVDEVRVTPDSSAFELLQARARTYREQYPNATVGQVDGVGDARRLYRKFGIDPTSTRPSSEALLRRALKGLDLYHVNNVVDVGNLASLASLLPLGLYDRDRLEGSPVHARRGREGEEYPGIRKGPVHVGGRLCMSDDRGAFGSPTSDSFRTRITDETNALLVVVFGLAEGDAARLEAAGDTLEAGFAQHAGGNTVGRQILS